MRNRSAGITLSYVNTFLHMFCGLFLSAFLLRSLGKTEYGIYQTIASFANYLVLLQFGVGTVMTRNLSVCRSKNAGLDEINRNISTLWTITNVLAGVILLVSVGFYFSVGIIFSGSMTTGQIAYGQKMLIFITVYLLFSFYNQALGGIPLSFEKYTYSSLLSIVTTASRTLLLISLIFMFKYSIIIAIVDMSLSVASFLYTWGYCKQKFKIDFSFKNFDFSIFKASLPLCIAIFLQVIVNQANNNVDKFIIGIKMKPADVALYSVGLYIYSIFSSLTTIPITIYAPQVAANVTIGHSGKKLTDSLIQPSRLISLIGGMVLFGFIAVGKQFISIVYGKDYLLAWWIALIIMVPMFINMTNGVIVNVLDVLNKRIIRSLALLITTITNIILTIFFIDWFGIIGATIATGICTLLGQVLIMNIYYQKSIGIHVLYMFFKTYKGILVYQFLGMAAALIVGKLIENIYLSFIAGGVLFVIIALGGFILFGMNDEERKMLHRILPFKRRV